MLWSLGSRWRLATVDFADHNGGNSLDFPQEDDVSQIYVFSLTELHKNAPFPPSRSIIFLPWGVPSTVSCRCSGSVPFFVLCGLRFWISDLSGYLIFPPRTPTSPGIYVVFLPRVI